MPKRESVAAVALACVSACGHQTAGLDIDGSSARAMSSGRTTSSEGAPAPSGARPTLAALPARVGPGASDPVPCDFRELDVHVTWRRDAGGLRGAVTVINTSGRTCSLISKPVVEPLDEEGSTLGIAQVQTTEARLRPLPLLPGSRARAGLAWTTWCGRRPSGAVLVDKVRAQAVGPSAPRCHAGEPPQVSSTWFRRP